MILLRCCTQYVSKFGKLTSGHRAGNGQFSFQSQRKVMPKNVQTTTIVLLSHARNFVLKILQFKLQQYIIQEHLDVQVRFKVAEEPEIKLPAFVG